MKIPQEIKIEKLILFAIVALTFLSCFGFHFESAIVIEISNRFIGINQLVHVGLVDYICQISS